MNKTGGFLKKTGFVLAFSGVVTGAIGFYIWHRLEPYQVQAVLMICRENLIPLVILFAILSGVIGFGLESIYNNYIHPIKKITEETAVIYSSNMSHRLSITGSEEISALVKIINHCAGIYEQAAANVTEQILSTRKETERERNLLAAIMTELPHGMIICNRSGRILLFNSQAKKLFTSKTYPNRVEHFIGLGRSIFHFFDRALITHAIEDIEERLGLQKKNIVSNFITPIYGDLLLSVEAMPVLDHNNELTGFIFNIQDISNQVKQYDKIDNQLLSFQQAMSSDFYQAKLLINDLLSMSDTLYHSDRALERKISNTLRYLEKKFKKTALTILDYNLTKIPLTRLQLSKFLFSLQKKAGTEKNVRLNITNNSQNRRILADSFSLTAAFLFLLENLSALTGQREFDLIVHTIKGRITFDIFWKKYAAAQAKVNEIITKKIEALPSLGYVFKQNQVDFEIISDNTESCSQIRIFAQAELKSISTRSKRGVVLSRSRPEFYDFNLFKMEDSQTGVLNQSLENLIFSVFDTETTGLEPEGGDEILSIAAVRIVNTQIIHQDIFEELVDPKRDIPLDSYKIHGINYDMVEGKPDIETILPLFKIYTYDTVLVGHNIAFDMKMLRVKEKITQTEFTNPVLDTLLLSALLNPMEVYHDLESIADRMGVSIIGRHTALGDAISTAEIFLKLIPLLRAKGIVTLKDALEASQKTYYSRIKY